MLPGLSAVIAGTDRAPAASIDTRTVSNIKAPPTSYATYKIKTNGNIEDHTGAILETWLDSGDHVDFDVRATLQSGITPTNGTVGSWQGLLLNREWEMAAAPHHVAATVIRESVLLIEIRLGVTVVTSATITLQASWN